MQTGCQFKYKIKKYKNKYLIITFKKIADFLEHTLVKVNLNVVFSFWVECAAGVTGVSLLYPITTTKTTIV